VLAHVPHEMCGRVAVSNQQHGDGAHHLSLRVLPVLPDRFVALIGPIDKALLARLDNSCGSTHLARSLLNNLCTNEWTNAWSVSE
jgi:hypothetical protein